MNKVQSKLNKYTQEDNRARGAERRELVRLGIDAGKLRRKIAAELGFDEGTIRRDLRILQLPDSCLTAIENGASAENQMRRERQHTAENARRLRVALEKRAAEVSRSKRLSEEKFAGCHSKTLARLLFRWLNKKLPAASYMEQLLQEVKRENGGIGDQLAIPVCNPSKVLMLCGEGDEPGYMPDKIEFLAGVLLSALPLIAPEWIIRCLAIEKTIRAIENPRRYLPELRP